MSTFAALSLSADLYGFRFKKCAMPKQAIKIGNTWKKNKVG
jgi:hypothetical protein